MIIKKVKVSGFDVLYDYVKSTLSENRQFGNGLFGFLNHQLISLELGGITTIELFYLKKFSSIVKIIDKEYGNFINEEKSPEIHEKIKGLLSTHDEMINDDDINKSTCHIDNILPIGCEQYHVFALFKGSQITSITGAIITDIFKDKDGFFEFYPGNGVIENKIAELFFNSFYKFMSNKVVDFDLVSDFMVTKRFYNFADDVCSLSNVNTPLGEIVFFNNNPDRLNKQVSDIKKLEESSPYYIKDSIYLTFVLKTTFSTFMKLYLYTNFVVDNQNLRLVFIEDNINISDDIASKYNIILNSYINYLNSYKKELNESTEVDLNKFNFILNGSNIIYSIQLTLDEIDKLDNVLKDIDELEDVKNKIKSTSGLIDNLIG